MAKSYNKTHDGYRYQITDPVIQRMNNPTIGDRLKDKAKGLVSLFFKNETSLDSRDVFKTMKITNYSKPVAQTDYTN